MTKLATALTLALVLAGCGSTPLFGAKVARSASARIMSSGTMTITAAKQLDGAGGLLSGNEDFALAGTDADGKFTIAIHAVNPGGELYVPQPERVTLNDQAVPQAQYAGLGKRLAAAKASADAKTTLLRAASILQLAH